MSCLLDSLLPAASLAQCVAADRAMGFAIPLDRFAGVIARAMVYKARVGQKRSFLSEADALAYERGWSSLDAPPHQPSPEFAGWCDREDFKQNRFEVRREEALELDL